MATLAQRVDELQSGLPKGKVPLSPSPKARLVSFHTVVVKDRVDRVEVVRYNPVVPHGEGGAPS